MFVVMSGLQAVAGRVWAAKGRWVSVASLSPTPRPISTSQNSRDRSHARPVGWRLMGVVGAPDMGRTRSR